MQMFDHQSTRSHVSSAGSSLIWLALIKRILPISYLFVLKRGLPKLPYCEYHLNCNLKALNPPLSLTFFVALCKSLCIVYRFNSNASQVSETFHTKERAEKRPAHVFQRSRNVKELRDAQRRRATPRSCDFVYITPMLITLHPLLLGQTSTADSETLEKSRDSGSAATNSNKHKHDQPLHPRSLEDLSTLQDVWHIFPHHLRR
jgi:hypothetical protein